MGLKKIKKINKKESSYIAGPLGQQYIHCWPEGPAKDLYARSVCMLALWASNMYIAGPEGQQKIYMQDLYACWPSGPAICTLLARRASKRSKCNRLHIYIYVFHY